MPLRTITDFDPEDGGLAEMLREMEEGAEELAEASGKALYQAEGPVSHLRAESITRGAGKYKQYFIEYVFMCAGRFVTLTIGEDTPMLHAVFRKNHPFMLAEGDRVRLIVGEDTRTVKAMRNFEDGCAYWLMGGAGRSKIKNVTGWLLLIPAGMVLLGMLIPLLDSGRIDLGFAGLTALCGCGTVVFIVGILWLCSAATRHFGAYRADLPVIIEALDLHPAKNKTKPYIHEL